MSGLCHSEETKQRILARIASGESQQSVSLSEGISTSTIRLWQAARNQPSVTGVKPISPPIPAPQPFPKIVTIPQNATVLAIPDMHHPFSHPDTLAFLKEVRRVKQTNLTICLGDEIDAASFSRYIPDPDGMSPGQELAKAIEHLTPFYREFPDMLVCESNHTVRPWKKAYDAGLPASFLPTYSKILNAPDGWHWASKWEIDGVLYIHGDNGKSGQYAHVNYMKAAKRSVVHGHIHSYAGVNYEAQHFAVNAGCLIDDEAYCFKYAKNMLVKVNLGCAVIYEGKYAEFVPMRLDANKRWIGKL